jgi:hypothetical protein
MSPHKLRIREVSRLQRRDRNGAVTVRPILPNEWRVVRSSQYHRDNNAVEELSVLRHKE